MECYYRHRQLGVTLGADEINRRSQESWAQLVDEENMTFDSPDSETAMQRQVSDLVRVYLDTVPKDEKPLAVEVAAEAPLVDPFTGEDLGIPLVGVIDLVLDGETGPIITDFKTAARSSEPMEISHEIQLTAYAWLHRQITGQQEAGLEVRSLIKTKVPKCEFHPYAARTDCALSAIVRGDPRVSRLTRLGPVQLPARLWLWHVRFPHDELFPLGRIGRPLKPFQVIDRQRPSWLLVPSASVVNRDGGHTTSLSGEKRMRAQKSLTKGFDHARVVAHKAVERVPASTKHGFHNGRKAGHDFVENLPYGVGAAVGFVYGAGEAIVGALAEPVGNLLGWASSLVCGE